MAFQLLDMPARAPRSRTGSLRVKVYAGQDRLLRRPLYLQETVTAGPDAEETWERAERLRDTFLEQIRVGKHPRSDATVDQLMDIYLGDDNKSWDARPATATREITANTSRLSWVASI